MLSQYVQEYAARCFEEAKPSFGNRCAQIEYKISQLSGDEKTLMELVYGTMPTSDVGGVPFFVLQSFARHALKLREESPFCRDVPEDIFLHFVFYPRINSEDMIDCRPFFYAQLHPLLQGLDPVDAVRQVNVWCAENMTYQTTNDRTENPITAYYSGLGRCGEESVFAVTAYRSLGIPARQIYVPWWSHCNDNHAWVEVYVNGGWHYTGACEPEPVLDRGWFTDASSRAPLVCYRTYMDYQGEGLADCQLVERRGVCCFYNQTPRYAEMGRLTVQARDEDGLPMPQAEVRLSVVNMAAFGRIACRLADWKGEVALDMGRGSVHIEVQKGGLFGMADVTLQGSALTVQVALTPRVPLQGSCDIDWIAPATSNKNKTVLTEEQRAERAQTLKSCAFLRERRIGSYWKNEYDNGDPEWEKILRAAGGNASELNRFYTTKSEENKPLALEMLKAMESKDYRDSQCCTLDSHFAHALPYRDQQEDEWHYIHEVLNPRIRYEMIEDWRPLLEKAFSPVQKTTFVETPQLLMDYINHTYPNSNGRYYPVLTLLPSAVLSLGSSDEKGRRILFVAIMRTLGVPARINPADESAEYWRDGAYHCVSQKRGAERSCTVKLLPQPGKRFVYGDNYSLARWQGSEYQKLNYSEDSGEKLSDPFAIPLQPGEYRLVTADRLPNGNQLCRVSYFVLTEQQTAELPLELREASPEEMLANDQLEDFALTDEKGQRLAARVLFRRRQLLIWLDVTAEPTEHILNEVIAAADEVNAGLEKDLGLLFIVRDAACAQNATLRRAMEAVPGAKLLYGDFADTAATMARKLFLEPDVWPLLALTDPSLRGYYGSCGYQVGVVELALKLAACIPGEQNE